MSDKFFNQLLQAFFLFRNRKGGVLAGATTFFMALSFCPALLLLISLLGYITGDITQAKAIVLETMKSNMPEMAPWIFKSITTIINAQLSASTGNKLFNLLILGYSLLGVISSMEFGLNTIHNKRSSSGFFLEDAKSIFLGFILCGFLGTLLILTNKTLLNLFLFSKFPPLLEYNFLFKYQIISTVSSLVFFTLFFKITAVDKVQVKSAFQGAVAFVSCFIAGKSFYWVYVNISKDELTQSYGNFYTIIVAVMWMYYLIGSFFFSASVASIASKRITHKDLDLSLKRSVIPLKKSA